MYQQTKIYLAVVAIDFLTEFVQFSQQNAETCDVAAGVIQAGTAGLNNSC